MSEQASDKDIGRATKVASYWDKQLDGARRYFEKWQKASVRIVRRYRDERDVQSSTRRRFNILYSNVQVLAPALYGRKPKPEVTRRFKDQDQVGRAAATILERCLSYETECYSDFDSSMKQVVMDRLLPGRGIAWLRFESKIGVEPMEKDEIEGAADDQNDANEVGGTGNAQLTEDAQAEGTEYVAEARSPVDYVHWEDFTHSPARTWEEVWWVARRVWMTKEEGEERFGEQFKNVPLERDTRISHITNAQAEPLDQKAQVWEIWNKNTKKVCWYAKGYSRILEERDDPLQLEGFFPCPKPLFGIMTTDQTVPVPDYTEYQDQAEELDLLTQRISMLTRALKVIGVYNSEFKELNRMLVEGLDNRMIPVSSWAMFAEKGGLKGAMDWMPIESIIAVLTKLYEAREVVKQTIYEVMGISDIIRGSSKANETLGAQQIKANFGSMRLKNYQVDVARFASDIFRMKAEIMRKHYPAELLLEMSGFANTLDAQQAQAQPQAPQQPGMQPGAQPGAQNMTISAQQEQPLNIDLAMQAIQLLKSTPLASYRIEVEADTLAQMDDQQEKADRMEFLNAAAAGLKGMVEIAVQAPQLAPLGFAMLKFGVRGFKVGRDLEAAFEQAEAQMQQAAQQPKQPDPAEQAKAQAAQIKAQSDGVKAQAEMVRAQVDAQVAPIEAQAEMAKAQASVVTSQNAVRQAQIVAMTPRPQGSPQ